MQGRDFVAVVLEHHAGGHPERLVRRGHSGRTGGNAQAVRSTVIVCRVADERIYDVPAEATAAGKQGQQQH